MALAPYQFEKSVVASLQGYEFSARELRAKVSIEIGRDVSITQLDLCLRKLEKKRKVSSKVKPSNHIRGGRRRKIWSVTEKVE